MSRTRRVGEPGRLSICRPRGGDEEPTTARLQLNIAGRRNKVLLVEISLQNLAAALLGESDVACMIELAAGVQIQRDAYPETTG